MNNDYYIVEHSTNGESWEVMESAQGAGQSSEPIDYSITDIEFEKVINYYRLFQFDFNGKQTHLKTIRVDNRKTVGRKLDKIVNLMGIEVDEQYQGVKIYFYDDGTYEKILGNK
ncbi:MAG: hypothetical protein ACPG21_02905 [Crocinitomicaceae bacterium]